MAYAKVIDGAVVKYPYSFADMRKDNPNKSYPEGVALDVLEAGVVYPVTVLPDPPYDAMTQKIVKTSPVFDGSSVSLGWDVVPLSAEEIAANQQNQLDQDHKAAIKLETQVQNFIAMTPAQVNAYIDGLGIADPKVVTVLKFFGRMLLILVRREYRN